MIEERLRRIEDLLTMLLKRIEELERLLRGIDPQVPPISLAGRLMLAFSMPALRALEVASAVLKLIPKVVAEKVRWLHSKGLVSLRRSGNRIYVGLVREG